MQRTPFAAIVLVVAVVGAVFTGCASPVETSEASSGNRGWETSANRGWQAEAGIR